jgi:hypothetical protein
MVGSCGVGVVVSGLDCRSCLDCSAGSVAALETGHESWLGGSGLDHSVSV